jgi:hypothetical protein
MLGDTIITTVIVSNYGVISQKFNVMGIYIESCRCS